MSCDYCWPGNCCGGPNCMDVRVSPDWHPIDATAKAAGEVQVHRFGKYAWMEPQAAAWRDAPEGMSGWFTRSDEYLTPVPTHWKPQ